MRSDDHLDQQPSTEETYRLVLSTIFPIVYFQTYSQNHFHILMKQPSYANPLRTLNEYIKRCLEPISIQELPNSMYITKAFVDNSCDQPLQNAHQLFLVIINMILISCQHLDVLEQFLDECNVFRKTLEKHRTRLINFIKKHVTQLLSLEFDATTLLPCFFINDIKQHQSIYCTSELLLYFWPFYTYKRFLKRACRKKEELDQLILDLHISYDNLTLQNPDIKKEPDFNSFENDLTTLNSLSSESLELLKHMFNRKKYADQDSSRECLYYLLATIEEKADTMLTTLYKHIDISYVDSEASSEEANTPLISHAGTTLFYGTQNHAHSISTEDICDGITNTY